MNMNEIYLDKCQSPFATYAETALNSPCECCGTKPASAGSLVCVYCQSDFANNAVSVEALLSARDIELAEAHVLIEDTLADARGDYIECHSCGSIIRDANGYRLTNTASNQALLETAGDDAGFCKRCMEAAQS